ncbi:MAG: GntR family transcriptional regulator [Caldilineaceae bacterium]
MIVPRIDSEFIRYIFEQGYRPGDRLPSLSDLSAEIGISVGKLREQLEVARTLGLVEASPRRGIICTDYTFVPAVRLSLLAAMAMDRDNFDAFSGLRVHLETAYWNEAVALLTDDDKRYLRELVDGAKEMLNQPGSRFRSTSTVSCIWPFFAAWITRLCWGCWKRIGMPTRRWSSTPTPTIAI